MSIPRIYTKVLVASLLSLVALAENGRAASLDAISFSGGSTYNPPGGYTVGWTFTVATPIMVDSLGWYNTGDSQSHDIGIYSSTGTLLTSATVASTDPLSTSGFRYHSISNYALGPGSYTVGGLNVSTGSNGFYRLATGTTTPSAITYVKGVYAPGSSLTYPTTPSDQGISYFGPGFRLYDPASISLNFASDVNSGTAVGSNAAGVVFAVNWNDVPKAAQTNLVLKDSSSATVPGLTLTTGTNSSVDSGASFAGAGDTAMMKGHIYRGSGANLDLTFTGKIPYDDFDIYIYYNSGAVTNTQTFSILDSSGGSLGLSQTAFETPGSDAAFVLSNGLGNNANYVRFAGLTSADIPTNFIIRASGAAYTYFNGLQIVGVPEPHGVALALGALGGLAGWIGLARRRRSRRG